MIIIKNAGDNKMLYKLFSYETEWSIFQNIIATEELIYTKSKSEKILFHQLRQERWIDNTDSRPDFVSEKFMIELFEVDDIVTSKKGSNNPQRKADAKPDLCAAISNKTGLGAGPKTRKRSTQHGNGRAWQAYAYVL